MIRSFIILPKRLEAPIILPKPGISTRIRPRFKGYFDMFRVVPGCFPVTTSKPTISLMRLLLPALGLPVKTKYLSSIPNKIGKRPNLYLPESLKCHLLLSLRGISNRVNLLASSGREVVCVYRGAGNRIWTIEFFVCTKDNENWKSQRIWSTH